MGGFFGFMFRQLTFSPKPLPDPVSLDGMTALVTGANAGLGLEAARELSAHKLSRLIIGVRDVIKGEAAKETFLKENPQCDVQVWQVDCASFDSLIAFAEKASTLDRLDYALLNAGVKKLEFHASAAGHEENVQVNHLGTALLSLLLIPTLKKNRPATSPARMTIVSSEVHFWTPFKEQKAPNILARMDQKDSFGKGMERYYTSKLLNVLWTRELASKVDEQAVVVNTVNPGFCYSSLHRDDSSAGLKIFLKMFGWTSEQGGHCLVDALVQNKASNGGYLSEQKLTPPSKFVLSNDGKAAQTKLWKETLEVFSKEAPKANLEGFNA